MVHRTDFYLKFNTDSTVRLHQHFSKNARHPSLPLPLRALRGSDGIKGTTVEQSIALITSTYGVVLSVLCMVSKRGSTQRFQIFAAEPKQRRGTVRLHRYSYYIEVLWPILYLYVHYFTYYCRLYDIAAVDWMLWSHFPSSHLDGLTGERIVVFPLLILHIVLVFLPASNELERSLSTRLTS